MNLLCETPDYWIKLVLSDVHSFLRDHAHNERKVAASAMTLSANQPSDHDFVEAMMIVAREELKHFQQVHSILRKRNLALGFDEPDPYMTKFHKIIRKPNAKEFFLDRLLCSAVVEARGCEKFRILSKAFEDEELKDFYRKLCVSEERHHEIFLHFAKKHFPEKVVESRLRYFLEQEQVFIHEIPKRSALH